MFLHQMAPLATNVLQRGAQLGALFLFWLAGDALQRYLQLPISAGILGLFLALSALILGVVKLQWLENGAQWILAQLVLFFIPCVVGLMKYQDLFLQRGGQLLLSIVLGTVCVMAVTAYSVRLGFYFESVLKKRGKPSAEQA